MMRERNRIASSMDDIRALETEAQDAVDLWEMAEAEGDKSMFAEVEKSIRASLERAKTAELKALLPEDAKEAIGHGRTGDRSHGL